PTDSTRATLRVTGVNQTNVITGNCAFCDGLTLKSVQIDGNRGNLGWVSPSVNGNSLIEMGGTTRAQLTNLVFFFGADTRGWGCFHAIEGTNFNDGNGPYCDSMKIQNSQFGPCGFAPSPGQPQERSRRWGKRDSTPTPAYRWADGISHACKNSVVTGNTITDATDGGIVIFGAPNSKVYGNTIIAATRQLMGGINAVDWGPFNGNYSGVQVYNNNIISQGAMIKIGIALGPLSWGSYDNPSYRNYGGTFQNNILSSGPNGYFAFGVTAAALNNTVVTGNSFSGANFGGVPTSVCTSYTPPSPGPLYWDPTTTSGLTLQNGFNGSTFLVFLICDGPGPVTISGYSG
ncbi:hypothetical protein T439DRAFT_294532, partial [Meredithblackwellia eburnea MCA 4105]